MALNKNKVIASAQKYVQKGQLDKAIREYTKLVDEDPTDVRSWLKIGDLQSKKGNLKAAVQVYQRVARHYTDNDLHRKAVAVFKQILKLEPKKLSAHLQLAQLHRALGHLNDSRRQLEIVLHILGEMGDAQRTVRVLEQMVPLDPENVAVRIRLAESYSKEKQIEEAITHFTAAADILRAASRFDEFIRVAERLLWHQPDNVALLKELATLYLRRGDPRRALQKLQACYKADDKDAATLNLLADAFQALELTDKVVTILKVLAAVHRGRGETEQAGDVYRRVLSFDASDEEALSGLKALEPEGGAEAAAAAPGDDFVEGEPTSVANSAAAPRPAATADDDEDWEDDADLAENAAIVSDEELEVDEIEELEVEEIEELEVEAADEPSPKIAAFYAEAEVYEKFNLLGEALGQLELAIEAEPDNIETLLRIKDIYVKMGEDAAVVDHLLAAVDILAADPKQRGLRDELLREVLTFDPNHEEALELLGESAPGYEVEVEAAAAAAAAPPRRRNATEGSQVIMSDIEAFAQEPSPATEEIDIREIEAKLDAEDAKAAAAKRDAALGDLHSLDEDVGLEYLDRGFGDAELGLDEDEDELLHLIAPSGSSSPGAGRSAVRKSDTAVVSVDDALGGDDIDDDDDLFQDELSALEETEELITSLRQSSEDLAAVGDAAAARRAGAGDESFTVVEDEPEAEATGAAADIDVEVLQEELEETDFFIQQGLYEDAMGMLRELGKEYGDHPLLVAKIESLKGMMQDEGELADDAEDPEGGGSPRVHIPQDESDAFHQFKEGVAKQVGEDDADTHFDIGIAYKEMGMFADAIGEFRLAARPHNQVQCSMMIALCHRAQGQGDEAIAEYRTALQVEAITGSERRDIEFQLGAVYEEISDFAKALAQYESVAAEAPNYRDVGKKVEILRGQVASGGEG